MSNYGFIVPVYNHPHYIQALIEYLTQFELPIILVNDGSDAECTQLLRDIEGQFKQVILVEHAQNQGKGQAVITGLKKAVELGLSHALQIDSDGQHDWNDIAKFIDISKQYPHAMIIGQPVFDETVPKG
ncbi:MAG: glycosyltransferase family 2 protein, partial [Acinetobacter sp.]